MIGFGLFAVAGCPNPNVYGTARTIPKGETQHTVAAESLAVVGTATGGQTPTLPTYQVRFGVAAHVDLGLRVANFTSLGGDVKWNLLRGKTDVAIAPGFTGTYVRGEAASSTGSESVAAGLFYVNLPVLIGFNLADNFTLVLSPGIGAVIATASVTSTDPNGSNGRFAGNSSAYGRFGVGLNVRATDHFALHPEVTAIKEFGGEGTVLSLGLGFSFGGMPRTDREERVQLEAREQVATLERTATVAASDGDCMTVQRLFVKLRELGPRYRNDALERGPEVAACLVTEEDRKLREAGLGAHDACIMKRKEISAHASTVSNLKERTQLLLSMPQCGPSVVVAEPSVDHKLEVRSLAWEQLRHAAAAARAGDCASAQKLELAVREADLQFHDSVFVRDAAVARCLATVAPVAAIAPVAPVAVAPVAVAPAKPTPFCFLRKADKAKLEVCAPTEALCKQTLSGLLDGEAITTCARAGGTTDPAIAPDDSLEKPDAQPVVVPTALPVVEPKAQLVVEPKAQPKVQPVLEPKVQPVLEPKVQPVLEPKVQPVLEPKVQPVLERNAPPVVQPPPRDLVETSPGLSGQRTAALGAAGLGVVAFGIGTWAGLDARSKRDDARSAGCSNDLSMCPMDALALADSAYSRGNLATGFFVGSAVLVVAGVALWFTPTAHPAHSTATRVAPTFAQDRAGLVLTGGF